MDIADQRMLINALTIGADINTAAQFIGLHYQELNRLLANHPDLARDIDRAQATAEINHIRTLNEAAKDPRYWRASVFWLKAHNPDQYARPAKQLTKAQIERFTDALFAELAQHFPDEQLSAIHDTVERQLTAIESES